MNALFILCSPEKRMLVFSGSVLFSSEASPLYIFSNMPSVPPSSFQIVSLSVSSCAVGVSVV